MKLWLYGWRCPGGDFVFAVASLASDAAAYCKRAHPEVDPITFESVPVVVVGNAGDSLLIKKPKNILTASGLVQ